MNTQKKFSRFNADSTLNVEKVNEFVANFNNAIKSAGGTYNRYLDYSNSMERNCETLGWDVHFESQDKLFKFCEVLHSIMLEQRVFISPCILDDQECLFTVAITDNEEDKVLQAALDGDFSPFDNYCKEHEWIDSSYYGLVMSLKQKA